MPGTLAPTIDPDIKRFVDAIGAKIPLTGTEHYSAFRKLFKRQNYFQLGSELLVVKISRSNNPFWGLTKAIIDTTNGLNSFSVVLLTSATEGWLFSKSEVNAHIRSGEWPLALDGNYKINSPLPDNHAFKSVSGFRAKCPAEA